MKAALQAGTQPPALPATTALPKAPVLGWDSFWPVGHGALPHVGDLPHRAYTSSGRAALHAALLQMSLPAGAGVLVPTYHCPTMVAPIVEAGMVPLFYPLDTRGLPALPRIDPRAGTPRAMFVTHFFGLAQSLAEVRAWCTEHGILMVEDCAHSFFGIAGERPVGHWGDYATASLSKFFPVTEAGLLASASCPLTPLGLRTPTLRAQVKSAWDLLDRARQHGRLAGLAHLFAPVFWLRDRGRHTARHAPGDSIEPDDEGIREGCDMARIREAPSLASRAVHRLMPSGRIAQRRRDNYATLARLLDGAPGARALAAELPPGCAPYVMPLWVDGSQRADAVYARMRAAQLPVFRWDRLWPGTPRLADDVGMDWSRQILQLLCHQDLSSRELADVAAFTRRALADAGDARA